jgi:hypothetical protein
MVDTVYKGKSRTISLSADTFARDPGFQSSEVHRPQVPPYQPEVGSHSPEIIYVDASEPEKLNKPGPADPFVVDSNVFTPPGNLAQQPKQPDDPTAILSSLSSLQNVDGGFGTKSADVMRLILPLSPSSVVQLLSGYNTNIVAALLAWLWMVMWGGIEAITSVDKLNRWIRGNARGDLNVDAIQSKLYETSSSID